MTNQLKATAFWNEFHTAFPNDRVYAYMCEVAEGKADWFRNLSLTNVAIAESCRIGRIGFDEKKLEAGKKVVENLLTKYGLTGVMQW